MWTYEKKLQYPVRIKTPNARTAKYIISQLGGPDGELAASLRYMHQRYTAKPDKVKGVLTDIATEELAHVEMISAILYQLADGLTPEQILERILGDFGLEFTDTIPAAFQCDCSKERVARAIATLSKKDLDDIIKDGEAIEVKCQFCNKAYHFDVDELKEMRK